MGHQLEENNGEKRYRIDGQIEKSPTGEQTSDSAVEESGTKRSAKWSRNKLIWTGAAAAVGVLLLAGGLALIGIKMAHKFHLIEERECHSSCDSCLGLCGALHNRSLDIYFNCSEQCRAAHSERCSERCTILAGEHLENFTRYLDKKSLLRQPPNNANATLTARANPELCAAAAITCANSFRVCSEHCRGENWFTQPGCYFNCALAIIQCVAAIIGCAGS